jgi:hypothetical protein
LLDLVLAQRLAGVKLLQPFLDGLHEPQSLQSVLDAGIVWEGLHRLNEVVLGDVLDNRHAMMPLRLIVPHDDRRKRTHLRNEPKQRVVKEMGVFARLREEEE